MITNLLIKIYIIIQYKQPLILNLFIKLKNNSLYINSKSSQNNLTQKNKTHLIDKLYSLFWNMIGKLKMLIKHSKKVYLFALKIAKNKKRNNKDKFFLLGS